MILELKRRVFMSYAGIAKLPYAGNGLGTGP